MCFLTELVIAGLVVGFIIGFYVGKKRCKDAGNATGFDVKVDSPIAK